MKKGISLVALVITIVVLIILTGTIILSTMNNNIFDNTNSIVNEYNKKIIIEDIQTKIQIEKLKKANQGIYTITMEEIIPIIQEHGTFNNNILKLTTTKGMEIWLYEIMQIPLEEYATITYENSILTIQTELINNGYRVQYTTDAGSSWGLYNNPVTIQEESGIQIRLINEQGQVVSNTLKITGGVIGEVDNTNPIITIEPNGIGLAKDTQVTITVTDNNELANNNTYEYYLSTSSTTQAGGSWITYTNGTAFTIGTNLTGTYYLHVKPVYDTAGNTSGNVVSQSYTFDNTAPYSFIPTVGEVTKTSITVNASTSDNNGQTVTYQYSIDNGETWQDNNTFENLTVGTTYSGIQVKAIDSVGNERTTEIISVTTNYNTLAELNLTASDYGTTVSYSGGGVTEWRLFYHQIINGETYYYIITSDLLTQEQIPSITGATIGKHDKGWGTIYWSSEPAVQTVTTAQTYFMANWGTYSTYTNGKCISALLNINNWSGFINNSYSEYIVGVIGSPTAEMFTASWNAYSTANNKGYTTLTLSKATYGYLINDANVVKNLSIDEIYLINDMLYWCSSPGAYASNHIRYCNGTGYVSHTECYNSLLGVRPIICLKANCLAYMNGDTIVLTN